MNDTQYLEHNLTSWRAFSTALVERTRNLEESDPLRELALAIDKAGDNPDNLYQDGPALISRLFTLYPDFAPTFPRELLWFLGGECLHFMPDEEIALYQRLDDARHEAAERGEVIDFEAARARLQTPPK